MGSGKSMPRHLIEKTKEVYATIHHTRLVPGCGHAADLELRTKPSRDRFESFGRLPQHRSSPLKNRSRTVGHHACQRATLAATVMDRHLQRLPQHRLAQPLQQCRHKTKLSGVPTPQLESLENRVPFTPAPEPPCQPAAAAAVLVPAAPPRARAPESPTAPVPPPRGDTSPAPPPR